MYAQVFPIGSEKIYTSKVDLNQKKGEGVDGWSIDMSEVTASLQLDIIVFVCMFSKND